MKMSEKSLTQSLTQNKKEPLRMTPWGLFNQFKLLGIYLVGREGIEPSTY